MLERAVLEQNKKRRLRDEVATVFGQDIAGGRLRFEAYDISNTGGADSVGAIVVFENGAPDRSGYRKFRIRGETKGDDYAAMQEVLYRRLQRAADGDAHFATLPDALLIDGGVGHVNAASLVTKALRVDIPVAGMVKDERHRTRGIVYDGLETDLKELPELYHLLGRIQEEVHRFAIEYHRSSRRTKAVRSQLEDIPGIGEKRRNALLLAFGSIDAIRVAAEEELTRVPGMDGRAAKAVRAFFAEKKGESAPDDA
jgi:excinuclease ABC subunit C